jgi:hypothetical protein
MSDQRDVFPSTAGEANHFIKLSHDCFQLQPNILNIPQHISLLYSTESLSCTSPTGGMFRQTVIPWISLLKSYRCRKRPLLARLSNGEMQWTLDLKRYRTKFLWLPTDGLMCSIKYHTGSLIKLYTCWDLQFQGGGDLDSLRRAAYTRNLCN